jgi:acyl-CoA synthetase (AMP-forming)/AMP-acid ligase II
MIGYLNNKSPFDKAGWYNTKDLVETRPDGFIKIVGRKSGVISVGGLKILPSEIERIALKNKNIKYCKAYGKDNPITGQHVEIICEPKSFTANNRKLIDQLKVSFQKELNESFVPLKIKLKKIDISYRYKKSVN